MNVLDMVLLVFISVSALIGLRGFIKEFFSLVAYLIAAVVALLFSSDAEPFITDWIAQPLLRRFIAGAGLFVLTLVAATILVNLTRQLVKAIGLGGLDSLLGFAFGALRGVVILVLVRIYAGDALIEAFPELQEQVVTSKVMPFIDAIAEWLVSNFGMNFRLSPLRLLEQLPIGDQD